MALVNIINVTVMDNPTAFTNPFQFEVTFECLQELPDGELRITYGLLIDSVFVLSFLCSHFRSGVESYICWKRGRLFR